MVVTYLSKTNSTFYVDSQLNTSQRQRGTKNGESIAMKLENGEYSISVRVRVEG